MNTFLSNKSVEAISLVAVRDYLEHMGWSFVSTDGGDSSKHVQKSLGDLMVNDPEGRFHTIEVKAEREERPNLFLEVWSNRNLEDAQSHAGRGCNPGWMYTCGADFLFYHFIDTRKLIICQMFALKQWAFCAPSLRISSPEGNGRREQPPGRIWDFPESAQRAHEQKNDTRGRLVPIEVLLRELKPAPKIRFLRSMEEMGLVANG